MSHHMKLSTIILALFAGFLFLGNVNAGINDGLVAFYRLDGNANDSSGNGNHGVVFGATPEVDRFGEPSGALSFDGIDDYISFPRMGTSNFTILTFIKTDTSNQADVVFFQGWSNSELFGIGYRQLNSAVHSCSQGFSSPGPYVIGRFHPYAGDQIVYVEQHLCYPVNISDGQWHSLAVSYDGQTAKLYLDGRIVSSFVFDESVYSYGGVPTEDYRNSTVNFTLGAYERNQTFFQGHFDDVYIYNRALSEFEMAVLARSNFAFPPLGDGATLPRVTQDYSCHGPSCFAPNRYHPAIDFEAMVGTPVYAAAPGTVAKVCLDGHGSTDPASRCFTSSSDPDQLGTVVVIQHDNNLYSLYAHLSRVDVSEGQEVNADGARTQIGLSGDTGNITGPHLHFELKDSDDLISLSAGNIYPPDHPNIYGYFDPWSYFTTTAMAPAAIDIVYADGLNVRREPTTATSSVFTEVAAGQSFVALARHVDGSDTWYRVHLPCANSNSCAGWVAGVVGGTTYSAVAAGAAQLQVTGVGAGGLNVRAIPGGSIIDKVYDSQRFVYDENDIRPASDSCHSYWYSIDLVPASGSMSGYVCGDYAHPVGSEQGSVLSLRGRVSLDGGPLAGVDFALTGSAAANVPSGGDGTYAFTALANGDYGVTPSLAGYEFDPASRSVALAGASRMGIDFRACDPSVPLSGYVVDAKAANRPLVGVSVNAGGLSARSDATGYYQIAGLSCATHSVAVAHSDYVAYQRSYDRFNSSRHDIALTKDDLGVTPTTPLYGDPVNTATGNYVYQRRDLELPGIGMPLQFDRAYNSRAASSGSASATPLGYGWSHGYQVRLTVDAGIVTITWGDGHTETYTPDGVGGYVPHYGVFDTLANSGDGTFTLTRRDGTDYAFDTSGRLASITDKNANVVALTYTGANLTQITDTAGRLITLDYDPSGRITLITDPIGRTVRYAYDLNGNLIAATDPNGNLTQYGYDAEHQILTVVDPRGHTVVSNTYDAARRVVTYQTDAKGNPTTYAYQELDRVTTITDALGKVTLHHHDDLLRLEKEVDARGGIALYDYDTRGNRVQVTDKNGNITRYDYDLRGNVTRKTDALGKVTTIAYDAADNPLSRSDALGNLTQFAYDANGNLIETTDALGNIASVTYTAAGQPQTLTDALGHVTTHAYDAEGNRMQTTDPLGHVTTHTYDGVGRRLSSTDPLGRITTLSYDANDNLLTITDPLGHAVTHTYDGNNNRLSTLDRNSNLTSFSYDEKDLLASTTDALGNITANTYDALDRKIAITDARGNATQYGYDAAGNQTQVTDALGNITRLTYDANGNRLSATDARGHTTSYQYDALNRRTRVTDPLGQGTVTAYDPLGQVVSVTSAIGQVTTNTYDALGRLIQVTNALGGTTHHGYDANGNRISTTDPRGSTSTFGYDALDRRVTATDALGHGATTVYDAAGQVVSVTEKRGNTTTSGYDAAGRLVQVTDALGNVTQHSYEANGNRLSTTDALGRVVSTAYDALNRVASRTDAGGASAAIGYDAAGNIVSETDRNGHTIQSVYDAVNRRVQATDAQGHATQYAYDAVGNRLSLTDPLGHAAATGYDANNRPITTTDPLGNVATIAYDAVGRVMTSADAEGQITTFGYDVLDRLVQVTDAQGGVVSYSYDANGNRLSMTDPNGNTTVYTYDVLNRQTATTEALGYVTTLQYDAAGQVNQRTDARGLVTLYAYDSLNRLVTTTYPGPKTVTFGYDAVGNRTQMIDSLGTTSTTYDARNRITQVTDPFGMTVQYGYDPQGNRTSLTYPGNKTVTYGYDAGNRLTSVTDWLTHTTTYQYDAANRLTQTTQSNRTQASYGYDSADRLTSLLNRKSDASVISSYAYTLDGVGNHLAEDRVEPLNPLLQAETQSHAYDAENRLTDTNAIVNSFDANGNLTVKGTSGYAYDEENRLTQTIIGATTTQYAHDGLGNRYSRTRAGSTTRYVLDANTALTNVLAETDTVETIQAYNVYGLGLIARILPDNTTHYYHYDSRGSTVALTNATEAVTDSYAYDPFGKPVAMAGSNANPFRYLGRHGVQDEGDNLNYIRARYYDTEQQRFVSMDSYLGDMRRTQTLNRYAYAVNNPIRLVDRSGFSPMEVTFAFNINGTSDRDNQYLVDSRMAGSTPALGAVDSRCKVKWWKIWRSGCYSGGDYWAGQNRSAPPESDPKILINHYFYDVLPQSDWDAGAFFHDFSYSNVGAEWLGLFNKEDNYELYGADRVLLLSDANGIHEYANKIWIRLQSKLRYMLAVAYEMPGEFDKTVVKPPTRAYERSVDALTEIIYEDMGIYNPDHNPVSDIWNSAVEAGGDFIYNKLGIYNPDHNPVSDMFSNYGEHYGSSYFSK